MASHLRSFAFAATVLASLARPAGAASWNENIQGDLSDLPASPTLWTLDLGPNPLLGGAGFRNPVTDYDLISFTIPAGAQLDSITVDYFQNDFSASFFGLQPGTPWLDGVGYSIVGTYLSGWVHVANEDEIADLLDALQPITPDLTIPLPSGTHTLIIQDPDGAVDYEFTFNVSAVPAVPGDFNGDTFVDGADLTQWIGDFGVDDGSDADGDNDTDGADFLIWQRNFAPNTHATTVSEPTAAFLALLAIAGARSLARVDARSAPSSRPLAARAGERRHPCQA